MKILTSEQVKEADAYTIENEPIASIDLMERAAKECFLWIANELPYKPNTRYYIFAGSGNNGGDGLVIARLLASTGNSVTVLTISDEFSPDTTVNYKRLQEQNVAKIIRLYSEDDLPEINNEGVIIDALFGSGLSRPIEGFIAEVVRFINQQNATVIAIDTPSGLFAEDNSQNFKDNTNEPVIVKAHYTLTFQMPFLSFLFADCYQYTGKWIVIPIGLHRGYIEKAPTEYQLTNKEKVKTSIRKRKKTEHKGSFGHALLIAGSYGKTGAALLGAKACLRTGAGLLTVHTAKCGYSIVQTALPEAMVVSDKSKKKITALSSLKKYNAIAVGPGIGTSNETLLMLENLLNNQKQPMVFDADALNLIAKNKELLQKVPKNSIFTPHPKEFERLAGKTKNGYQQNHQLINFARENKVIVVLKGAYTAIALPNGMCYFNTSGTPAMATAGSGDVLTGMLLSLLAQGYTPVNAVITGVYLHGMAGEIAAEIYSEQAVIASDIIENIGKAYLKLTN